MRANVSLMGPIDSCDSGRAYSGWQGESVTRGDRRDRELEFESSFPPLTARPNRRRE